MNADTVMEGRLFRSHNNRVHSKVTVQFVTYKHKSRFHPYDEFIVSDWYSAVPVGGALHTSARCINVTPIL